MSRKILIVSNTAWNVHHFRRPLIQGLEQQGFTVLCAGHPDETAAHLPHFYPLPELIPQGRGLWQDLKAYRALLRLYRQTQPDLILHFTIKPNIFGSLAAKHAGIRSIPTITGLGYTALHRSLRNLMVPQLYRRAFSGLDQVVFQNQDDRQWMLDRHILQARQCRLIRGSGVDTDYFSPTNNSFPAHPVFLFIGRLLTDKGIRELLAAMTQLHTSLPKAELWLIGDAHTANPAALPLTELERYARHPHIKILGVQTDVRPYLQQCTCLVLPSYREGVPRAVLEAMAMGKPIITTDAPGCRDTVQAGQNGWLVPARSAEALQQAMREAAALPEARLREMGVQSRKWVLANFDQKIIVGKYLELVRESPVCTFFDQLAPTYADRYGDKKPLLAHFHRERLQVATDGFDFSGKRVLDVGCGTGQLYEHLRQQGPIYLGIDRSPAMQQHSVIPSAQHRVGTIDDLQEAGFFDYIFMLGLSSYLSSGELKQHLDFCRDHLPPGGTAIISFTHRQSLDFQLRTIVKRGLPSGWFRSGVLGQSFPILAYTPSEVKQLLPSEVSLHKIFWLNQTVFPFNRLAPRLAIQLAAHLPHVSWLSSDFLLFLKRSG